MSDQTDARATEGEGIERLTPEESAKFRADERAYDERANTPLDDGELLLVRILSIINTECLGGDGPNLIKERLFATLDAERGRREEAEKFIAEDTAALKSIQGALTDAGCAVGPQNGWGDAIRGLSARSRHLAGLLGELIACGDCDLCRDHKAALKGEKVTDGR